MSVPRMVPQASLTTSRMPSGKAMSWGCGGNTRTDERGRDRVGSTDEAGAAAELMYDSDHNGEVAAP